MPAAWRCARSGSSSQTLKSLAGACHPIAGHRAQEAGAGQRVMLENQIRGLAVVFGVRLPRALSPAFIKQALQASEEIDGLSAAMRGLIAARAAVLSAVLGNRYRHEEDGPRLPAYAAG